MPEVMDVFLGLDLGTTNCKVLAIDIDGQPLAGASLPTPVKPPSGGVDAAAPEYDALDLWNISARLIRLVVQQLPSTRRVAGLAVASMGESGVLIDREGVPLAPVMTWHDRRTLSWVSWWRERITDQRLYQISGLPLDYLYSANKLLWLRHQNPDLLVQAVAWLSLADWITFCLTGKPTTSFSQASRSMLFDLRRREWSDELLRLADLPANLMPPPLSSGEIAGVVTRRAAEETGLQDGLPVLVGGHDHICAALAAGAITPGVVLDSAGTVEALMITLDAPLLDAGMETSGLCCGCHTARDRYYLIGGIMGGGVLAWVSRMLAGDNSPEMINRLMQEAGSSPPGAQGVWFVPYLDSNGPPRRDPHAWGAWLGLQMRHTRSDLARAAVEGISYGIRYLLDTLQESARSSSAELRSVGGGTLNAFWQQVKADVIGAPIDTPAIPDITAQGAALLAGIGTGAFPGEVDASTRSYRSAVRYPVDPERSAFYDAAYRSTFRKLYSLYQDTPLKS